MTKVLEQDSLIDNYYKILKRFVIVEELDAFYHKISWTKGKKIFYGLLKKGDAKINFICLNYQKARYVLNSVGLGIKDLYPTEIEGGTK